MTVNPNYPLTEHGWGPLWGANGGMVPGGEYVNLAPRTLSSVGVQRGRQYELDQVQAGTLSGALDNKDGVLDPANAAGPWYGHIAPFQPYRVRMQYPPTVNLLNQFQATGGDAGGYPLGPIPNSNADVQTFSATDSTGGSIVSPSIPWQGSRALQFAVPNATGVATTICYTSQPAVIPGQMYTVQMQIRNISGSTSIQVRPHIAWYNSNGSSSRTYGSTVTLAGGSSAAWSYIGVSVQAPAGAFGLTTGVSVAAVTSAATSLQIDAWQLELASAPSAFVIPGITYPLYAGFVERWPSLWLDGGTRGVVQPTAVDAFALLSQRKLRDPLTEEIYSRSPRFLYRLADPSGSSTFADDSGNFDPIVATVSKNGAGSIASGVAITSASPSGGYTGSSGTVVTLNNANPGSVSAGAATYLSMGSAGITGPDTAAWSRMIAFRYTGSLPTNQAVLWAAFGPGFQPPGPTVAGNGLNAYIDGSGHVNVTIQGFGYGGGGSGGTMLAPGSVNVCDSNWHLLIFGYDANAGVNFISLDGTYSSSALPGATPANLISDNLGAYVDPTTGQDTRYNVKADFSYAAEFPSYLASGDVATLYAAWKSAFTGDSTALRYSRILGWAGYSGPTSISAGLTSSMGPAVTAGSDAMSLLAAVVETENGVHYVNGSGTVVFKGRNARYNALTVAYVFGERTDLGESPYEELQLDFDSTHLGNLIQVAQAGTSQVFSGADSGSQAAYFPRTLTRTVNSTSALECQDAANYLLSRYKNPLTRVSALKLHPSAVPALWPVCLSLEIGTRIRVMRRPNGAPPIQVDVFVEHLDWQFTDQGEAWLTIQCSPVDPTPYGVASAFHSTMNGPISAGATSFIVNAALDIVNPLAAQIGAGQQLVLGLGLATQETVTVKAPGATYSGWSSGALVLTAGTTYAHAAGEIVCEPLPAGVTDPTTWDNSARFDSSAFCY